MDAQKSKKNQGIFHKKHTAIDTTTLDFQYYLRVTAEKKIAQHLQKTGK